MTPSPRRMFERQREDDTRERHSGCKETVPEQRKKRQGAEEAEGKWQHLREDHSPNKRSVSRPRRPMSRSPPLPQLNRERAQPAPTRPAESIRPGSGKEAESKLEARGSEYQERKEYKDEVKGQELPGKSNKDHKRGNQGGQSSREPAPETSSSRKEGKSKTKQKSVAPPPAIGDTASPATLMKWKKGDVLYCSLCLDKGINSPHAYRNRTNLKDHMLGRHGMTPRPRAPYVMRDGKWKVPYEIRQPTQAEWEKFIADRDLKKKKDQARGSARIFTKRQRSTDTLGSVEEHPKEKKLQRGASQVSSSSKGECGGLQGAVKGATEKTDKAATPKKTKRSRRASETVSTVPSESELLTQSRSATQVAEEMALAGLEETDLHPEELDRLDEEHKGGKRGNIRPYKPTDPKLKPSESEDSSDSETDEEEESSEEDDDQSSSRISDTSYSATSYGSRGEGAGEKLMEKEASLGKNEAAKGKRLPEKESSNSGKIPVNVTRGPDQEGRDLTAAEAAAMLRGTDSPKLPAEIITQQAASITKMPEVTEEDVVDVTNTSAPSNNSAPPADALSSGGGQVAGKEMTHDQENVGGQGPTDAGGASSDKSLRKFVKPSGRSIVTWLDQVEDPFIPDQLILAAPKEFGATTEEEAERLRQDVKLVLEGTQAVFQLFAQAALTDGSQARIMRRFLWHQ